MQEERPTIGLAGMTYSKAVYRLEVVVVDDGVGGLKIDEEKTNIRLLVDDDGVEKFTVGAEGIELPTPLPSGSNITFTNRYDRDEVHTQLSAIKKYTDNSGVKPLAAGMFEFALEPLGKVESGVLQAGTKDQLPWVNSTATAITVQNNMEGVLFPTLTFTSDVLGSVGSQVTYRYQITEVDGGVNGMTYDPSVYYADVVLTWVETEPGVGAMEVDVQYLAADETPVTAAEFTNTYTPAPVEVELKGSKTLNGRNMLAGEVFDFAVSITDSFTNDQYTTNMDTSLFSENAQVTNATNGTETNFSFGKLEIRQPGTYQFLIDEQVSSPAGGMTYDSVRKYVNIVVTDNNGQLEANVTYDNGTVSEATDKAVFVNTYKATFTDTPVSLAGTKKLTGRELKAGEFFFEIEPLNGAPLAARSRLASAGADGKIQLLSDLTFDAAGTYEYLIREQIPSTATGNKLNGITYDTAEYRFVVEVIDDMEGNLEVASKTLYKNASVVTSVEFLNTYEVEPEVIAIPTHYKVISGNRAKAIAAGEFEFEMTADVTELDGTAITGTLNDYIELPANAKTKADTDTADGIHKAEVAFGNLTIKKTGLYTITIREIEPTSGKVPGVTYSKQEVVVVYKITDDEIGNLQVEVLSVTGGDTFTNTYESEGAFKLTIDKNFTGRSGDVWLDTDKFQFEVVILDPATQAAVDAGKITFPSDTSGIVQLEVDKTNKSVTSDEIKVYEAGTYKFRVREVTGTIPGVNYDPLPQDVEVTATDKSDGTIEITTNVPSNTITFNNVYDTDQTDLSGHDNLRVIKEFIGRAGNNWLDTDKFTFTLSAGNNATTTAINAGDVVLPASTTLEITNANKAHAHFGNITFKKVGTYTFNIKEEASTMKGVVNDSDHTRTVVVNVVDGGEGILVASLDSTSESLTFTNRYIVDDVELIGAQNLVVEKVLTGRDWFTSDAFTFTLEAYDEVTKNSEAVTLPANATGITLTKGTPKAHFGNITFKEVGTYQFQIKEVEGSAKNVRYDSHSSIVTVVVTDNNEGELVATPSYSGALQFENVYTPDPIFATLEGVKILEGRSLKAGEFRFHIAVASDSEAGTPMPALHTVANDAAGNILFPQMSYAKPGTYKYVISEIEGSVAGITYDKVHVEATVEIGYNAATGMLTSTVTYKKGTDGTAFEFNNKYESEFTDEIDISAEKKVSGNPFSMLGNDFRFELEPAAANPADDPVARDIISNASDGELKLFEKVVYKNAGTYVYTVHEVDGTRAGITYDDTVYTITVVVTDDEAVAKLSADVTLTKTVAGGTPEEVTEITFDNQYIPEKATAVIHGHKYMKSEHKDLEAGEFTFEIKALTENTPMPAETKVKNAETGLFQFGLITYTTPGTYQYEISEVIPQGAVLNAGGKYELNGKLYDSTKHTVTVEVTDIGEGGISTGYLQATVNGIIDASNDPLVTFTNGYVPNVVTLEGATAIQGTKTLTGRKMKAGEFKFELAAVTTGAPMPKKATTTNTGTGAESGFAFDAITYNKVGEYLYTVREVATNKGGVTYDDKIYGVKVEVTDEGFDGQLDAKVTYFMNDQEAELKFENAYHADATSITLSMRKKLKGREMKAGEFTFKIEAVSENAPLPKDGNKTTNGAGGAVKFSAITYDKAGTYLYQITEVKGDDRHVKYDKSKYAVTVNVVDNGEGKLEATTEGIQDLIFHNVYQPDAVQWQMKALKKLAGRGLKAGEFIFVLEDEEGKKLYATNTADGTIVFEKVTFEKAGTYTFKVYEKKGDAEHVSYDEKVYKITIVVEDKDGTLKITSRKNTRNVEFNNVYDNPKSVRTGDMANVWPMAIVMILSAGYALATVVRLRKRER